MKFVQDLMGGILVIFAAGVIAIAQNAVRDDKIPWIPKNPALVSEKSYTPPPSSHGSAPAPPAGAGVPAGEGSSPALLSDGELASGEVSRERMRELLEGGGIVVIDARAAGEYEAGHIAGAINLPYEGLAEHYDRLSQKVPLAATVVCYCRSVTCDDSENLAREMKFMGYRNVVTYKGGWDEWSQAGYPAESSNSGKQGG
jgi:rhodanese-related sulfurtransferase